MAKLVIIGAGSGFGGRLSIDFLSREPLRDGAVIGLHAIREMFDEMWEAEKDLLAWMDR